MTDLQLKLILDFVRDMTALKLRECGHLSVENFTRLLLKSCIEALNLNVTEDQISDALCK